MFISHLSDTIGILKESITQEIDEIVQFGDVPPAPDTLGLGKKPS